MVFLLQIKKGCFLTKQPFFNLGTEREPLPPRRLSNLIDLNFNGLRVALRLDLEQVDSVVQMGRNFNS